MKMKKMKVKLGGMSITSRLPKKPLQHCNKLASSTKKLIYHQPHDDPHHHYHHNPNKIPLLMGASELSDGNSREAGKVPKGFVAVYVGPHYKRFVIPISFLTMPDFKVLMDGVAEEFGVDFHADGAIQIPTCDEDHFESVLRTCFTTKRMQHHSHSKNHHKIKLDGKIPIISTH